MVHGSEWIHRSDTGKCHMNYGDSVTSCKVVLLFWQTNCFIVTCAFEVLYSPVYYVMA